MIYEKKKLVKSLGCMWIAKKRGKIDVKTCKNELKIGYRKKSLGLTLFKCTRDSLSNKGFI